MTFFLRSFFQKIMTLFIVSVLSFLIIHLAPGDPNQIDPTNPKFTKEAIEQYRKEFHLDEPIYKQYAYFYRDLFTGNLRSWRDEQPVFAKIFERFLNSLPLFILGTLLTWTLAFPVGINAAIRRGGAYDRTTTFLSYLLISVPGFFLAYIMIIFAVKYLHVSVIGMQTPGVEGLPGLMDRVWHMVLPSILGATGGIAVLLEHLRAQMLEVSRQDYVRTARAKGLPQDSVYYRHALRNALLPFVTMFGLILPGLIGGSVIIEFIFAWPGMGRLAYDALVARDMPIVLGLNFLAAVLVLAGTFISDVLYMLVDPRIKYD